MQGERDLNSRPLADLADRRRERLPVSVRFRSVQHQDRIAHIVLNQVEDRFGHHHVRRGDPVVDGDDGPMRAVIHEGVRVEGGDPLVVQGAQHLSDRHASGPTGVDRPIEMDEENLRLRADSWPIGV